MTDYRHVEKLLDASPMHGQPAWRTYVESRRAVYQHLAGDNLEANMVSEANWILRRRYPSAFDMGLTVRTGDVCYMDFGQVYLNETGYQHFGLVMSLCRKKALIIPMTSNEEQYRTAFDPSDNPGGKRHLMRLGCFGEMNRPSVLFLNDMKFLNTARIIDIKAHLDTDSSLFRMIRRRMLDVLLDEPAGNLFRPDEHGDGNIR